MSPTCGKWSITSSITSDRGSCFEPCSQWIVCLMEQKKGKPDTHTYSGCGNLAILICFFLVCLYKTVAHFEQEVRKSQWFVRATLPDVAFLWSTSNETLHKTSAKHWPHTASRPQCYSVAESVMFITPRQRKLSMSRRLINKNCQPASPMPHISAAFTLHLRHKAFLKWQPAKPLQETLQ